jgi:abequosyltransferase
MNRPENIRLTLRSIMRENIDPAQLQVVISDNSSDDQTMRVLKEFPNLNIKYYKNPVRGFLNSIEALKQGDGELLKLQNDYSAFLEGGLRKMMLVAERELVRRPQILFTNSGLLKRAKIHRTSSFDDFIASSGYLNTWSTAFSIWRDDLHKLLQQSGLELDDQFPHTSLLLHNSKKVEYLIWDEPIFNNAVVHKKGGYNIFYNFCVIYPAILLGHVKNGEISEETYRSIIKKMRFAFFSRWLALTVYCPATRDSFSFDSSEYKRNIVRLYGKNTAMMIKGVAVLYSFAFSVRYLAFR